jgi:hypothetical protein
VRRRVWLWVGGITVLLLGVTCYVLAHHVLHGPVNGRSLYLSVNDVSRDGEFGGREESRRCRRTLGTRAWLCTVDERGGSDSGEYLVRVHEGDSCWEGMATRPGRGLPRRISGCVHLREEFF